MNKIIIRDTKRILYECEHLFLAVCHAIIIWHDKGGVEKTFSAYFSYDRVHLNKRYQIYFYNNIQKECPLVDVLHCTKKSEYN